MLKLFKKKSLEEEIYDKLTELSEDHEKIIEKGKNKKDCIGFGSKINDVMNLVEKNQGKDKLYFELWALYSFCAGEERSNPTFRMARYTLVKYCGIKPITYCRKVSRNLLDWRGYIKKEK